MMRVPLYVTANVLIAQHQLQHALQRFKSVCAAGAPHDRRRRARAHCAWFQSMLVLEAATYRALRWEDVITAAIERN